MSIPIRSHRRAAPLSTFLYGSPYYPEHWDAAIREGDPALFRAAGWNVIRMAEFAWDVIEPEEGRFDFSLFDETIERMGAAGIQTILCTPTATPPRWLTLRYPEVLRVDDQGVPLAHGSRQHASHMSPKFREHSRRITRAMAEHYAGNPHVIGWQTDNEIHCHFSQDHSPAAQEFFVQFLRERFHNDIRALNRAWGTAFWAQTYSVFEEIPTPKPGRPTHLNPAHVLDYRRALAHGAACFQHDQVEILRAVDPRWWVTHNGCFELIDYAGEFGLDLDFLSYDSYPLFDFNPETRPASQAFNMDYSRAFSGNLLILEQQAGPGGQGDYFLDQPEPGDMRRMAYVNIARGADGMLFFRERTCRFGAEEYWCGIIDHDNVPRRRYREAAQLGEELSRIGSQVLGTSVEVNVGVAGADFAAQWGHDPITLGLPNPRKVAETVHTFFYKRGNAVGCVHPADELTGLSIYFVPHFAVFDPAWIPGWENWVREGGVLVIGARTATKDLNNNVVAETSPGALRPLVGATVEEYGKQNRPEIRPLTLVTNKGDEALSTWWYEVLQPDAGTEVVATWKSRHLAGSPAATLRRVGRGAVIYVGTYFTQPVLAALEPVLAGIGALPTPTLKVPGVETVVRAGEGRRLRFVINHNEHAVEVPLPKTGEELITGERVDSHVSLDAGAVAIIREE
ncbi:MAG TPA: beta-galactosidase [Chthoniobacterales bacterium]|jgi:beta-galactosidase